MDEYNPYSDYTLRRSPQVHRRAASPIPQSERLLEEKKSSISSADEGTSRSLFPLSLGVVAFWVVFIVGELVLLERSADLAPKTIYLPWYYSNDGLPSVFATLFAQGHVAITAMHLGRLAISALQLRRSAPRTWIELFWMTDRKWAGPVGILMTFWSMITKRIRVSWTFVMFSFTILVALVTPLVLNRAYPIQSLDVSVNRTFTPNTLTPSKLGGIDANAQIAAGGGAWATNLTVVDLFNTTTFTPVGTARGAQSSDFFFAGDVLDMDVVLPGLRIQGGCHPLDTPPGLSQDSFTNLCKQQLPSINDSNSATLAISSLNVNVSYCATGTWAQVAVPSNVSTLVWFSNTNISGMILGDLTEGVVRCDTSFTAGTSTMYGRSLTFNHFHEDSTIITPTQAGEPLLDPLFATLWYLFLSPHSSGSEEEQAAVIDSLGYIESSSNEGLYYTCPSLDGYAEALWRGATHMTNTMALLSRASEKAYPATAHVTVSGRVRDSTFFTSALALLGVWLFMMMLMTVMMWKPTAFGDSLDSYAAARLISGRTDLVDNNRLGGLGDNEQLLQRFDSVHSDI